MGVAGQSEGNGTPAAVIFDCDGVLVDSEPISNALLAEDLFARGLPLGPAEVEALFIGGTMAGVADRARELGAAIPEGWVEDIYRRLYARLEEGTPPMPGVAALLDRLDAAGLPYAVASNGSLAKMRITLGQTGLWPRFEGRILSAHEEGVAKPDPELFLRAARRLGAPPSGCVVVGDSPADAKGARAAGMRCLGLAHGQAQVDRLAALGAEIVRTLAEVPPRIGL